MFGTLKDYYIAEGDKEAAAAGGGEPAADLEARGSPGVNRYTYWATDSVTGDWVELPDATPVAIRLARQIKMILTGNLDAEVISNPFFPGKEKDLLRAQIARISQATTLIPKGLYKKVEDNDKEIVEAAEEEKKMPTFDQLAKLDFWCHYTPNILKVREMKELGSAGGRRICSQRRRRKKRRTSTRQKR